MKRLFRLFLSLCLVNCQLSIVNCSASITLNNVVYEIDTLAHYQVGPGAWYTSLRMTNAKGTSPHNVFLLHVDAKNPYISFESVLAKDSIIGTERPSSMAKRKTKAGHHLFGGVNADFFTTSSTSITEGTSCLMYGRPSGGVIVNGEMATVQSNKRQSFAVDASNHPYIGAVTRQMKAIVKGDTLTIYNVNYTRSANKLTLFNHFNGSHTTACTAGTEVLLSPLPGEEWSINHKTICVVEQVAQNNGRMAIPAGKVVLSGNGTMADPLNALQKGDTVPIYMNMRIGGQRVYLTNSVGGPDANYYAQMLRDGVVVSDSIWNENHPRTGLGYSVTGDTIIFCVCDGRTSTSTGVTTYVEGQIMKAYGAWNAINLDGGGSSCLYLEAFGKPMNYPSDGSERACGNGFFAVSNAPEDTVISRIEPYAPELSLPAYSCSTLSFLGYNQYGVLLNPDVVDVNCTCDPSVGYFLEDGRFVAVGEGDITATKDGVSTTVHLHIMSEAQPQFRLDSVLLSRNSVYQVEIFSQVGDERIWLLPEALTWQSEDPSVAVVSADGSITPVATGRTRVWGNVGSFSDTLTVVVDLVDDPYLADDFTGLQDTTWSAKASASKWVLDVTRNDEGKMAVAFDFSSARLPNIKLTHTGADKLLSSPEYLEIRVHSDEFPLSQVALAVDDAKGIRHTFTVDTTSFAGEMSIMVPVDEMLGADRDYILFPLTMQFITFYIPTSAEVKHYSMTLDGIYLYYGEPGATALPETESASSKVIKRLENGQILIRKGNSTYTLTGQKLQ